MKQYLKNLNWRYATKRYDTTKKVAEKDLETLKEVVRLSASSYGLQPYKVLVVEDIETRKKLKEVSWNQPQITETSHLFVFANYTSINENHIKAYMQRIADTRNLNIEDLSGLSDLIKGATQPLNTTEQATWAAKQTYIALGNLLSAAASLKIDATPMEGFDSKGYDKILNLSKQGLSTAVIAAVGYRSKEDATQHQPKVRKSKNELFISI